MFMGLIVCLMRQFVDGERKFCVSQRCKFGLHLTVTGDANVSKSREIISDALYEILLKRLAYCYRRCISF